jgi:hypothetical protein
MAVDIENNTTSSDDEDAKVKAQSEMFFRGWDFINHE